MLRHLFYIFRSPDKTVDGITYDVYTHGDANTNTNINAELWVQKGVITLKRIQRAPSTHNQIIQTIAVNITCTGD
jgi:hypothetical protein